MAGSKPIPIDVVSDTVCPWCYIGKRRLEKAIQKFPDKTFEVRWHPFLLNPAASEEGQCHYCSRLCLRVDKRGHYHSKFGEQRAKAIEHMMTDTFAKEGLQYTMDGKTGSTINSHRLIYLAGQQSTEKQDKLVEALFKAYFTQGKFINDPQVLLEAAQQAGVEGAEEYLKSDAGRSEVLQEIRERAHGITGVPNFTINGQYVLSGAQDPDTFATVFERL
eukprot:jgi/Astpho2/8434/Aster-07621